MKYAMALQQPIDSGLRELALFAGAGGGILGGKLLGWRTVCAVEINDYARRVLIARQDDGCLEPFPIWDDVRTFDGKPWRGIVDVVSGGFPCQDISIAAGPNRAGIDGERSGLWREMVRVVCEVGPRFVFVENSPNLVVQGLGRVLSDLSSMGYDAKWGVFGAGDVAGPHERKRTWVVASDPNCVRPQKSKPQPQFLAKAVGAGSQWNGHTAGIGSNSLERWGWSHQSTFVGVADGLACRSNRLKAIGNGQVPAVVRLAWSLLAPSET